MKTSIFLFIALLILAPLFAWGDCPFGEVNDTYPGNCGRYVDTDKDGICDHSQLAPDERQAAAAPSETAAQAEENAIVKADDGKEAVGVKPMVNPNYDVLGVAALTVVLYAVSYFLAWKKITSVALHRKIWNAVLLATFLVVMVSAAFTIARANGIVASAPEGNGWFHNFAGTVFIIVSLFHAAWHIPYFKAYLPAGKSETKK